MDCLVAFYDDNLKDCVLFPLILVLILNKLPDKGYFLISPIFNPFLAVETYNSLFLGPPNVQFVIFFAGKLILCIFLPFKL